jgi:hypothetical protein
MKEVLYVLSLLF